MDIGDAVADMNVDVVAVATALAAGAGADVAIEGPQGGREGLLLSRKVRLRQLWGMASLTKPPREKNAMVKM